VRSGESLWSIAASMHGAGASNRQIAVTVSGLWKLNSRAIGTGDPNVIHIGTRLRMPVSRAT
jgi:Tfp pilus assembly protein FimV